MVDIAFELAAEYGHVEIVRLLFREGGNFSYRSGIFENALELVIFRGNKILVQMLLAEGAEVNAQSGNQVQQCATGGLMAWGRGDCETAT